jgi:hypothetical protein
MMSSPKVAGNKDVSRGNDNRHFQLSVHSIKLQMCSFYSIEIHTGPKRVQCRRCARAILYDQV